MTDDAVEKQSNPDLSYAASLRQRHSFPYVALICAGVAIMVLAAVAFGITLLAISGVVLAVYTAFVVPVSVLRRKN